MTTCELRLNPIELNVITDLTHSSSNARNICSSPTLWRLLVVKERLDSDSFSQHTTESKHPTSKTTAIDRFLASPVILKKGCNNPLTANGRQNGLNLSHRNDASNAQHATTGAEQNYTPQTNPFTAAYLAEKVGAQKQYLRGCRAAAVYAQ